MDCQTWIPGKVISLVLLDQVIFLIFILAVFESLVQ